MPAAPPQPDASLDQASSLSSVGSSGGDSLPAASPATPSGIPVDATGLFGSAPPNSRFGSRKSKDVQPVMQLAADQTPTTSLPSVAEYSAASGAEPYAGPVALLQPAVPIKAEPPCPSRPKSKAVSPFAAAAQASLQTFAAGSDSSSGASSPPSLFGSPTTSPTPRTSGDSPDFLEGSAVQPPVSPFHSSLHSLAPERTPRPSFEHWAHQNSAIQQGTVSPFQNSRPSLAADRNLRPSLEHMAHLRGFVRSNSTPSSGLGEEFAMPRTASIRASPRPADVVQEIAVMKKLNHPNIVRLVEVGCHTFNSCCEHEQVVP